MSPPRRNTIKGLLWEIIPEAAEEAGGRYPVFSQRDLYYKCRDLYKNHPDRPYHREHRIKRDRDETDAQYEARRDTVRRSREPISYKYFTTKVLKSYLRERGPIERMYIEPHGTYVEPHTGNTLELGTLEVAEYTFPPHSFDKILLVEKRTERPKFEHDRIGDRYDMAMVYSSGYATGAIHELLSEAEDGEYQIFVWHDADVDGYNIVRNLRDETDNMPVAVDIIDLGLTVSEALRIGCSSEPFEDDDALPYKLAATLTDLELEYFGERQIRFEINGIPADQRMAYVEERLREAGIRPKYVPPADELEVLAEENFDENVNYYVRAAIARLVDTDAIVTRVTRQLRERLQLTDAGPFIREQFEYEPTASWSDVVEAEHDERVRAAREEIAQTVADEVVSRETEASEEEE
jgi:hypothetical protein